MPHAHMTSLHITHPTPCHFSPHATCLYDVGHRTLLGRDFMARHVTRACLRPRLRAPRLPARPTRSLRDVVSKPDALAEPQLGDADRRARRTASRPGPPGRAPLAATERRACAIGRILFVLAAVGIALVLTVASGALLVLMPWLMHDVAHDDI